MQSLPDFHEIYVCCPGNLMAGGAEALHQLVDALRRSGKNASISYLPTNKQFETPAPYQTYDVEQRPFRDDDGCLVVFPEIWPDRAVALMNARSAIWWLSVDYYLQTTYCREWSKNERQTTLSSSMLDRDGLHPLRRCFSLAQSFYAQNFLEKGGISAPILCGYINDEHIAAEQECASGVRDNIIAYNPKKGIDVTEKLMKLKPDADWIPLDDMSRAEVRSVLRRAKLYIDFGAHPGRDRLPREAAISGACVLTGRRGSAGFAQDMPIPEEWRIDETRPDFDTRFAEMASLMLADHSNQVAKLAGYRASIRGEKSKFFEQVSRLFTYETR